MRRSRTLPLIIVGLVQALFCSSATQGQLPKRLQRCLPYPTFAQEIQDMRPETTPALVKINPPEPRLIVDSVDLEGSASIPGSVQQQVEAEVKGASISWARELLDYLVRGALQDQGYFLANLSEDPRPVANDSSHQHVDLTIHVDEGPKFFLGQVAFRSADPDEPLVFRAEELREQVPLEEGDPFVADKIRDSLDRLRNLYGSQGYIDFTAEPEFDIDESHQRINLTLVLDQQKQFHVGQVKVLTLNPGAENAVKSSFRTGDIFDSGLIGRFISENKPLLPEDASPTDVTASRNVKSGIVDLTFDFLTCPDSSN